MTINLDNWIGKNVRVTLRNGKTYDVTVETLDSCNCWVSKIDGYTTRYSKHGIHMLDNTKTDKDIIHIEENTMNTKQILDEINKTQAQLNKLQEKLKEAEKQEKFNSEFYTPITSVSEYIFCLKFLKTKNVDNIGGCFDWDKTPQGIKYWDNISFKKKCFEQSDVQQIKDWVINYLFKKESI